MHSAIIAIGRGWRIRRRVDISHLGVARAVGSRLSVVIFENSAGAFRYFSFVLILVGWDVPDHRQFQCARALRNQPLFDFFIVAFLSLVQEGGRCVPQAAACTGLCTGKILAQKPHEILD